MRTGLFRSRGRIQKGFQYDKPEVFPEMTSLTASQTTRKVAVSSTIVWEVTGLAWLPSNEQVDHQVGVTAI